LGVVASASLAAGSSPLPPPPLGPGLNQVNSFEFPFYPAGLNTMISELYSPSPCSPFYALHEAPSVSYNWWTDDQAKALYALSFDYAPYVSEEENILGFLLHNDVGGYLIKRCVQITPSIVSNIPPYDMVARNNLYIFRGNPTLGVGNPQYAFRVSSNENPTLTLAYIQGATIFANGVGYQIDNGYTQLVQDGGFDGSGSQSPPWSVSPTLNTTYYLSPPNSYQFEAGESVAQTLSVQVPTSQVANITFWLASSKQAQNITVTVTYTDGTTSSFSEAPPHPTQAPGRWTQYVIPGSSLAQGKTVSALSFSGPPATASTPAGTPVGVYMDNVALNAFVGTTSYTMFTRGADVVMREAYTNNAFNVTIDYVLQPGANYVYVNTTVNDYSGAPISGVVYNAFNGLDTIGSGYAWLYFPGVGWIRPNQGPNDLSKNYEPQYGNATGDWNQNWFAIGMHGVPDWIGNDAIFVEFNPATPPSQVRNTVYENNTYVGSGDFLHWVQIGWGYALSGGEFSYTQKWVFVDSYDWTNMAVYSNFLDGDNLNQWNNTNIGLNYYAGEVAQDLVGFGINTNDPQALRAGIGVWNYYYRMIQSEGNGTYVSSLARFVNASYMLYRYTVAQGDVNTTYLNAISYAANLLEKYQATSSTYSEPETLYFHQDSGISSVNGVTTYGKIFNTTSTMGVGTVLSGNTVAVSFFQSPPNSQAYLAGGSFTLNGLLNVTIYMNANQPSYATYSVTVGYVNAQSVYTQLAASPTYTVGLGQGASSPPFLPYTAQIQLSNAVVPYGAALEVHLNVAAQSGVTVYVLYDSSNGPSRVQIPFVFPSLWHYEFTIPSAATAATYTLTPALYPEPQTEYFHQDSGISSVNGVTTYGKIFNTTSTMGVGVVMSGGTVSANFFQNPPAQAYYYLDGPVSVTFYMNANTAGVSGTYAVTLDEVAPNGTTYTLAAGAGETVSLQGGSGSPPFYPYTYTLNLNKQIPEGWALEVQLQVSVPTGDTVYVLYDSTNGPSNVYLPILSETASIQGSYLIRTEQPYFLDTTAMAGWALMVAYHATGTQAYLTAAEDALSTIHWGMTPFPGFSVLPLGYVSIPDAYRLWVYANQTYIDTDFSTYKAMLVAYFAEQYAGGSPLNATLAETAMSRVWGRTSWTYTQASVYTGESTSPHIEINSETQPWGLISWYTFDLWAEHYETGVYLLYANFTVPQPYLYDISSRQSSAYFLFNAPPGTAYGTAFLYLYENNVNVSGVYLNGALAGWLSFTNNPEVLASWPQNAYANITVFWGAASPQTTGQSTPIYNTTNVCAPGLLPPTPLQQLEEGCIFPAVVDVYAGVIGLYFFITFVMGIFSIMVYLKSQNTYLALFILILALPAMGALTPGPAQLLFYVLFVVAIATILYFAFTRR